MTGNVCIVIKVSSSLNVIEVQRVKAPVLDGKIEDLEWMNATFLDFNFTFANGESHRANVYLGHNDTHFFVGAIIFNVGPNPFSVPDKVTRPDGFFIYFDVDNDRKLTSPEDAKGLLNFLVMYHGQIFGTDSINEDGFWKPMEDPDTIKYWRERRPEINEPVLWSPDENVGGNADVFGHGEYTNLDETFEFCFPLNSNDTLADGLHIKTGEAKTMGFALAFHRQGYYLENGTAIPDLYDLWPGEGFTPNVLVNASQYAHMHIDLGKPNNFQNVIRWLPVVAIIAMAIAVIFIFKKQKTNSERNKNSLETLEMISSLYLSM
jgi:hypothetical protein